MSYIIRYGKKQSFESGNTPQPTPIILTLCIFFAAAAMVIHYVYPQFVGDVIGVLLPGFDEQTAEAFSSMLTQIKQGSDAGTAVTAFCREVLYNGQLP